MTTRYTPILLMDVVSQQASMLSDSARTCEVLVIANGYEVRLGVTLDDAQMLVRALRANPPAPAAAQPATEPVSAERGEAERALPHAPYSGDAVAEDGGEVAEEPVPGAPWPQETAARYAHAPGPLTEEQGGDTPTTQRVATATRVGGTAGVTIPPYDGAPRAGRAALPPGMLPPGMLPPVGRR